MTLAGAPGFIPTTCTIFFGGGPILFGCIPRYSREGLGLSTKKYALPSLRIEREYGGRMCGGNGRRGESEVGLISFKI